MHRARHEANYRMSLATASLRSAVRLRRKRRAMRRWTTRLAGAPPDVLLGANVDTNRGIRSHLAGIQRYSSLRVELSPPDDLRNDLSYPDFHTSLREQFFEFAPTGIGNVHSHVYPFFIEWCREHSGSGTQWVHTYHSPYFPTGAQNVLEPWEQQINDALFGVARHADVRVSVSRWQQEWLAAEHGITTQYIPNGVDVPLCDLGDPERFRARVTTERFVLYIGANEAVKNPADVVRLAHAMPDQRFIAIGGGLAAGVLRERWGVDSPANLTYLGEQSRIEVQDALAASSALVVTSLWEGLPTAALEAMVHGVPVILADNPGCTEVTDGGRYGFLYRQGDLEHLESRTRDALYAGRNPASREHIVSEYDWRIVAGKLDAIYRAGVT